MAVSARATWTRALVLSSAGLALLAALVWRADPGRVLSVLSDADPKWLGLMLAAILTATFLGAINSYLISASGLDLRFLPFLGAYWCAWAFGLLVPGQVGDVVGISVFLRRRGLALPAAVGRLGVDKLISLFCVLAMAGGMIAIYNAPAARVAGLCAAGAACALLAAYAFSMRLDSPLVRSGGWRGQFAQVLREAHVVAKTRPLAVATNIVLTLVKLFLMGLSYWATFRAFGLAPATLLEVTITANSAGLIAYVPVSANGVGTVEAAGIYLFGLLGFAAPAVIAAYLTLRAANFLVAFAGAASVVVAGALTRHGE